MPDVICYPNSEDDVLKVVDFCIQNKIPLIPYGSATSIEGHTAAVYGGICLNMQKMNKILEINIDDEYVRVQPVMKVQGSSISLQMLKLQTDT